MCGGIQYAETSACSVLFTVVIKMYLTTLKFNYLPYLSLLKTAFEKSCTVCLQIVLFFLFSPLTNTKNLSRIIVNHYRIDLALSCLASKAIFPKTVLLFEVLLKHCVIISVVLLSMTRQFFKTGFEWKQLQRFIKQTWIHLKKKDFLHFCQKSLVMACTILRNDVVL